MAFILEALIVDKGDGTIKVGHCFYGLTEVEVETYYREHLASCEYFQAAENDGRVITEMEEIPDEELPTDDDEDDDE